MHKVSWECKLLGEQFQTLTKRFFAIRLIHIAEGLGDISVRAHRARALINAIKRRGTICKTMPVNADMLRRMHRHLAIAGGPPIELFTARLRDGLLVAFFFCLRISELMDLTHAGAKFANEHVRPKSGNAGANLGRSARKGK